VKRVINNERRFENPVARWLGIRNANMVVITDTTNKPDMDENEMVDMIESTETNEETDLNEPGVPYHGPTGNEMTKEEWNKLMDQYEVTIVDGEVDTIRTNKANLRCDMESTAKVWYSADIISTELFDKIMNEAKLLCTDDDFYPSS
jgi:hypothetical protein